MLTRIPGGDATTLTAAVWIDLLDPTAEEKAAVEVATGVKLPSRADLEEIESSSRVYVDEGALYLSTPILTGSDCMVASATTLGIVLTPDRLVTQRFAPSPGFDALTKNAAPGKPSNASDAFLRVIEMIVDYTADALEHASAELEGISRSAFRMERPSRIKHHQTSRDLQTGLRKLGQMSDGISHLRDTLLGLGRIAAFVQESGRDWQLNDAPARLGTIRGDITSLNDYQAHLSGKVQFLLDATLGFISIQQNDIVKTLTVVSVVGVPPVLIAGIYGMNFKFMPELSWPLGYPYALALIVVSALVPLGWLKWRGWM
jgi:magnesium transporter